MSLPNVLRLVFAVACVSATLGGLNNVFADNTEVEAQAREVACGATPCTARITAMERNPIKQAFQLQVSARTAGENAPGRSVAVKCQRAKILFGDYSCTLVPEP